MTKQQQLRYLIKYSIPLWVLRKLAKKHRSYMYALANASINFK